MFWSKESAREQARELQDRLDRVEKTQAKLEADARSIRLEWLNFYEKAQSLLARLNARKRWAASEDERNADAGKGEDDVNAAILEGRFPVRRRS